MRWSTCRRISSLLLSDDRLHHLFEDVSGSGAYKIPHGIGSEFLCRRRDRLIEDGERVAHGAVAGFGKQSKGIIIRFDFFPRYQVAQLANDVVELDRAKAEVLAARANRLRNVLRLGRRQHEDDVVGRFFERLQQRVEGSIGDLVRFVEDVDLEAVAGRAVACSLAEFADFVDAAVGGSVDFDDVDGVSRAYLGAGFANTAGLGNRMVFGSAIQRHGQDAGDGRLPDTAMSAEDVAVRDAPLLDGVLQGAGDMLLPDHVGEFLRTIFARQNGVGHEAKTRLYGIVRA